MDKRAKLLSEVILRFTSFDCFPSFCVFPFFTGRLLGWSVDSLGLLLTSGGHKIDGAKLGASDGDKLGSDEIYGIAVGGDVGENVRGGGARGQTACNGSCKSD